MFRTAPFGKCHIQVCRTLSSALRGSRTILRKLEEELGVPTGHTTADGLFTVTTAECLASCGTAPAMIVNDTFVENLDWPKVKAVIDRVRGGAQP
jgi:NADH-quinone oxidoreductase subunit E